MGDMSVMDIWERYSFPYSIMLNSRAKRFVDEGEDEVSLTYSKIGAAVAEQPGAKAWQIFDQKVAHLLGDKYKHAERIEADSIEDLTRKIGLDGMKMAEAIEAYNQATGANKISTFDPYRNDGLRTAEGYAPVKSNWALPIDTGPYFAYAVTVGITFTFGGIKTDQNGCVLNNEGKTIGGLYAMGEITGGKFCTKTPGTVLAKGLIAMSNMMQASITAMLPVPVSSDLQ